MGRRCFDHLFCEISLTVGTPVPRYRLWLHLHESGLDPESLTAESAAAFCGDPLADFLAGIGIHIRRRELRRLRRTIARFDPQLPLPDETFAGV